MAEPTIKSDIEEKCDSDDDISLGDEFGGRQLEWDEDDERERQVNIGNRKNK